MYELTITIWKSKEREDSFVMKRKLNLRSPYPQKGLSPLAPKGCPDIYPGKEKPEPEPVIPKLLKADTLEFVTVSDGVKRIFSDQDGLAEYGNTTILSPDSVSYMNLFINAMLQPPTLYQVQKGMLILASKDVPQQGVPIILQFIRIYDS